MSCDCNFHHYNCFLWTRTHHQLNRIQYLYRSLKIGARKATIVRTSSVNMKDFGDIPSENKFPLGRNFSKIVTEFADFFISTKHHYSNPLWKMRGWSRIVWIDLWIESLTCSPNAKCPEDLYRLPVIIDIRFCRWRLPPERSPKRQNFHTTMNWLLCK